MSTKLKLTPFRIQKYLAGLRYPARRGEIVHRALERGAGEDVLAVLRAVPDRWYPNPVDLSCQIGHPEHSLHCKKDDSDAQYPRSQAAGCA